MESSSTDTVTDTVTDTINIYKNCIINAHVDAENNTSKLIDDILNLKGLSGKKTRHLLNNICSNLSINNKKYYLEIGSWYGSTLVSALYNNNNINAIAIDNWSEFNEGNVSQKFRENISTYLKDEANLRVIEEDCFNIDLNTIKDKINFYMFDGHHSYESHVKAITYYKDILDDIFILYIDDWSWVGVRDATYEGLKKSDIEILFQLEDFSDQEKGGDSTYWNGFGLFVCKKT
jgi:hypothetical protein